MQYSITYNPQRNPRKPWLLRIWESSNQKVAAKSNADYLYNAQYWLETQSEVKATLAQYQRSQLVCSY